jgi:hypothetical protein
MAAVISLTAKYFLGFWLFDATMGSGTLTTDGQTLQTRLSLNSTKEGSK